MTFDITNFGYGAGLVMVGWISGVVVSFAFTILRKI